ncbi:hypothetical protein VPH35_060545 [Triticum aestivum]
MTSIFKRREYNLCILSVSFSTLYEMFSNMPKVFKVFRHEGHEVSSSVGPLYAPIMHSLFTLLWLVHMWLSKQDKFLRRTLIAMDHMISYVASYFPHSNQQHWAERARGWRKRQWAAGED